MEVRSYNVMYFPLYTNNKVFILFSQYFYNCNQKCPHLSKLSPYFHVSASCLELSPGLYETFLCRGVLKKLCLHGTTSFCFCYYIKPMKALCACAPRAYQRPPEQSGTLGRRRQESLSHSSTLTAVGCVRIPSFSNLLNPSWCGTLYHYKSIKPMGVQFPILVDRPDTKTQMSSSVVLRLGLLWILDRQAHIVPLVNFFEKELEWYIRNPLLEYVSICPQL